jgi:hypothetical protein
MKIQPYVEKLSNSKEYRTFLQKYKDAFMVAGFFVLDLELGQNVHQIDYYIPSQKKVAAFTLDGKITMQLLQTLNDKMPETLDMKTNTDLDELAGILEDEMRNRSMTESVKKIIAVIQNIKGKKIWNLNCVLSGMEILQAHVEDSSKTVLKMEKISMMDIMKKIPGQAMAPQKAENTQKKLEQLEKLEVALKKEKAKLSKEKQIK